MFNIQSPAVYLAVAIAAVASGPASAWSLFGPSDEEVYLAACEEVIKDRLRSPSSYKLIEVIGPEIRPATKDEYLGWDTLSKRVDDQDFIRRDEDMRELFKAREELYEATKPLYVVGFIKYEAANGFGASIQGAAKCSYTTMKPADEALADASGPKARVDGYSKLEWSMRAVRQISN